MKTTDIKTITFSELSELKELGIVILGAGGELIKWVKGFDKILKEEEIVKGRYNTFNFAARITGNRLGKDGRTDLVLLFNPKNKINVGKLAMWRIKMGDISWAEDFVVNYRKDYLS